jgi:hypothetical protein
MPSAKSYICISILKMFMRLSLLPLERVDVGLSSLLGFIKDIGLSDDFEEFVKYFKTTWLVRFPVKTWCVSDQERRSNIHLEGYNSLVKRTILKKPTLWDFLDGLMSLAHDASASFFSDRRTNAHPLPDRSELTVPLQEALQKFQANEVNELGFLAIMRKL